MASSMKPPATRKTKAKPKLDGSRQTSLFDSFLKRSTAPEEPSSAPIDTPDSSTPIAEPVSTEGVTEYLRLASLEPAPDPFLQAPTHTETPVAPLNTSNSVIEIPDSSPVEERPAPLPGSQGSVHDPIVITASPEKPKSREPTLRPPINSFFAPRLTKAKSDSQPPTLKGTGATSKQSYDAPYPTAETQHVRGEQQSFSVTQSILESRRISEETDPGVNTLSPSSDLKQVTSSSAWNEKISRQVSPDIQRYSISQISEVSETAIPSQKLWTEKWRPTCADQVLGNRENAIYLRDWLLALEVQMESDSVSNQNSTAGPSSEFQDAKKKKEGSKKRPRVIRSVEKKKKKRRTDDEDDWIVADELYWEQPIPGFDVLAGGPYDFIPPTGEAIFAPNAPYGITQDLTPRLEFKAKAFETLTNTILLTGPSGVGKTAAVYACAEELGWDVFEVYPGIGRRNGAGIENLVGEVGKNHHVKTKSGTAKQTSTPLGFFGKAQIVEEEPTTSENDTPAIAPEAAAAPNARQSLVLLEEVDILFKEDTGFWSSVIDFIKSCKRPVICTCNDISTVPVMDLPLQTTLVFQPCAPDEAALYLHNACTSEGYSVEVESLRRLYETPPPGALPSLPSVFPEILPQPDLRRTIYHLQLQCATFCPQVQSLDILLPPLDLLDTTFHRKWTSLERSQEMANQERKDPIHVTSRLRSTRDLVANHADLISFADSYLLTHVLDPSENANVHEDISSADDEVDCQRALSSDNSWFPLGSISDEKSDIACTALLLSRGILEKRCLTGSTSIEDSIDRFGTSAMFRDRMDYQQHISTAMENLIPLTLLATRKSDVYAEYVPYVREIVSAEDTHEEQALLKEGPGRTTRNSARSRYERSIIIRPEQRAALSVTAFSRTL